MNEEYLDRPEQWDELAGLCRESGVMGLDTEYHGWKNDRPAELDDGKSPVGRTRIHVWSVAVPTAKSSPLGYRVARGYCLPALALEHPGLVAVLQDRTIRKAVHNQSVDQHALANHGIALRGGINTLGFVRWVRPELINTPGRFKLKALMDSMLRRGPVCTFLELVSYERQVTVTNWKEVVEKGCSCGTVGCRKRKPEGDLFEGTFLRHDKWERAGLLEVVKEKTERGRYNLWEIVPGHERWELLVKYAIEDAVAALEILDLCQEVDDPAPFPYGATRPPFSQAAEEAVIEMEATGFNVDTVWCAATAERARDDEEGVLRKLLAWFVANAPTYGPHRREDVDPIWSSPTQKIRLFDELGFPRSPIWKKGRVKRGDVKMDGAAMEWVAKNHPPAAQVIGLMLHLQRIRSGLKYLVKLRDSGGVVHPIAGPAGDEDDRAGAVTGRLAIKGELECQQLPQREEADLYFIRRGIIA